MASTEWFEQRTLDLESDYLQKIFECETEAAVEAVMTYARFVTSVGLSPETFGVFLRVLEVKNHWVIDAMVGREDPFEMLSTVQPNKQLVAHIFRMLDRWRKGGIYSVNLSVILGVLRKVYTAPHEGYKLYPLSLGELNALAKHLDKAKGQDNAVNRAILACLDRISMLEDATNPARDEIAIQAGAIRNAFFDDRRKMEDVLPIVLLEKGEELADVPPRKEVPLDETEKKKAPSRRRK